MQESLQVDTQSINSQLHAIDLQIYQLNKQRAELLRRLNEFRSPMNRLPPEVLSQVFLHYTGNLEISTSCLMTLGAVCAHWRQTAWSSPQLWTDLNLDFIGSGRRNGYEKGYMSLLDTFYQNVGGMGLNVQIGRRLEWQKRKEVVREVLAAVLHSFSKKLRSLTIKAATTNVWTEILNGNSSDEDVEYPIFEELKLTSEWQHIPNQLQRTFFLDSPKFTRLFIPLISRTPGFGFQLNQLPWGQLTHVSTFWYTQNTGYIVELLSLCPNLVDFRLKAEWVIDSMALQDPLKPIQTSVILQHVQHFSWDIRPSGKWSPGHDYDEIDDALFKYVRLPAVTELVWGCPTSPNALDDAAPFFTYMSGSVQILHCLRPTKYDLKHLWGYFDALSELHITESWESSNALKLLTFWSSSGQFLLPYLRSLRLYYTDGKMLDPNQVLALLYSRRHGPICETYDDSCPLDARNVEHHSVVSKRWEGSWRVLEDFRLEICRVTDVDCWNSFHGEKLQVLVEDAEKVDFGKDNLTIVWGKKSQN